MIESIRTERRRRAARWMPAALLWRLTAAASLLYAGLPGFLPTLAGRLRRRADRGEISVTWVIVVAAAAAAALVITAIVLGKAKATANKVQTG